MTLTLRRATVGGTIRAPPSKSHTHRAYILGALSGNGSILNPLHSDDTRATLECLHALGFLVSDLPHEVRVGGHLQAPKAPLPCRESGTTLRLLTGIASLLATEVTLDGAAGLRKRPNGPLLAALEQLGAKCRSTNGHAPITVHGPLRGGRADLAGDVSSQFLSSLLLAAPLAPNETTIRLTTRLASRPYVDLTLMEMRDHGLRVSEDNNVFRIPGAQKVRQRPYEVPGDYSSAAFLLVAAATTGGTLIVDNLRADDPQGDRAIIDVLARFGSRVAATDRKVTVASAPLAAADVDVGAIPDLFPALCVLAARARGTSTIAGAPHLRVKESDRIKAMATNLTRAGIRADELPDGIRITGGIPKGITIESFGDHRIAMAMAVLALGAQGDSILPDENVVAKSYPNFHNDLVRIAPEVARF